MNRFNLVAASAALAVSLGTLTPAAALDKANPDSLLSDGGGGIGSPGPGDPILDPSNMPPGGDADGVAASERADKAAQRREEAAKRKEEERKKREAGTAVSIGKRGTSSHATPGPRRSICDAARDARARNSPAAPNLEAQCRATKP